MVPGKSVVHVERYPDPAALAQAAAYRLVLLAWQAQAARGRFTIALSGGSTPRALFHAMVGSAWIRKHMPWSSTFVFWGDERCVPPGHPDSNYDMAREALLVHVPIPAQNIHRMRGELDPAEAAADYERRLRDFFGDQPRFDMSLLGMGDDGHTASLFPGTAALHHTDHWVAANYVDRLSVWRITLTPPTINAAADTLFLVTGAAKAQMLRQVLKGPFQPETYPAQGVRPTAGRLAWLVDDAAASAL